MNISAIDWLQAADHEVELRRWRESSNRRMKHFSVEHFFDDVSIEYILWYLTNFDEESYRMWHPAHIGLQWEKKIEGPGAIHIAWEKIMGKLAAYRIRLDTPDVSPIPPKETCVGVMTNIIDTQGEVLIYILNEVEPMENRIRINCTFVFPEAAPDEFVEAHRLHNVEEVPGMVNKAITYLVQKTFGYLIEPRRLAGYSFIVPADTV
jgi:hypothetical protein